MVDGHRSGLDVGAGPHGRRTRTEQPPRLTCIPEVLTLGGAAGIAGVEIQEMAWVAARWNAKSGLDCWYDSGFVQSQAVPERRPRLVGVGCWSAVHGHGGCVMIALGLREHWRPAVMMWGCCVGQ